MKNSKEIKAEDLIGFARQSFNNDIKSETINQAFEIIGDGEIVFYFLQMAFTDYYQDIDNPEFDGTPSSQSNADYFE